MAGRRRHNIRPKEIGVKLTLPFVGEISGTWAPDDVESKAAWELYVELITRVTIVELRPGSGLVREALTSLYSLFDTTRTIMRKYGPGVAPRSRQHEVTFGGVAVAVLAELRSVLTEWHPKLQDWEAKRDPQVGRAEHERSWAHFAELHAELAGTRRALGDLAQVLADVADVADLLPVPPADDPKKAAGGGRAEKPSGTGD